MGGKDSKLSYITHDDALKRVNEAELKRLKDAFRRVSTVSGFMTESLFVREVLWDGVPPKIAQLLFKAFGGTSRGLSFKDLLSGLVVLTKGTEEEKLKLIFGMFADETFSYVQKDDMDRKIVGIEEQIPPALSQLFLESDQVSYDDFRRWVILHPDACIVSKWLMTEPISFTLSSDTETPTFYQTLAGVTHLEETDISELEKRYWVLKAQSKTGRFDQETFKSFVCPPMPETLCEALFMAFDENLDNHIDFKEIACGISACCRGPQLERQKFCFKIFDTNHDGKLDHSELQEMIDCMVAIRMENKPLEELESDAYLKLDPATVAKEILSCHDSDKDGCITLEEYLVWTVHNVLCDDFLDLISQICHVVLGLKPQTKEEEGKIIIDWLERENRKKREVGQVWYLVCMQWWNTWRNYVGYKLNVQDSNGVLPQSRSNSTQRQSAQHRSILGSIPWDDETVVVVSVNSTSSVSDTTLVAQAAQPTVTNHTSHFSNTFPRTSHTVNGSPRKYHLAPDVGGSNRSPSPSPKLHKKLAGLHSIPSKPGPIDNNSLIVPNPQKVLTLTNEGGRLKRDVMLTHGKDFELVPEPVWRALLSWYGGSPALPRTVVPSLRGDPTPELELYPVMVRLLRHQTQTQRPTQNTSFSSVVSGLGGMALSTVASFTNNQQPRRYLAFIACFSRCHTMQQVYDFLCNKLRFTREDMRLWKISSKDENNTTLLEDESQTVDEAGIEDGQQVLIEVRNKDLTWPEEMSQLAKNKTIKKDQVPTDPGATGLNNLGNTCFMNAALQCVSNTWPLTKYFTTGFHFYELNRTNPLGMKGHIAQRYGELLKDMWSGSAKTTAPIKLRWTIGKYAPRFNGFQQHDSQELLSFLLDGLHEDLNRVHDKPYVELKDSDGRPDSIVAQEAWDNHMLRNQSVIVDLFHGQLKSQVRCKECGHVSVKFDPFNYLSLPLPMDSCIHLEIIVMKLDGSVPIKYGVRLAMDEKYKALKKSLSELTNIPTNQILLVEILGPVVKTLPQDNQKIRNLIGGSLYAYELPPVEDIEPITAEEELAERKAVTVGLNEIQRGITTPKKLNSSMQAGKLQPALNGIDGSSASNTPTHSRNNSSTSLNVMVSPSNGAVGVGTSNGAVGVSPSNGASGVSIDTMHRSVGDVFNGFVIGVHRKMTLMDLYFLSSQKTRPSLFGTPIIIPCTEKATNQELYQFVWTQVARLVSPLPPSETKSTNHAQDCDDSLGYEYPFTLKVVQKDGFTCAWCPWYRFCRGCSIQCNTEDFNFGSSFIAIDWEPTALHLRYQTTCERFFEEHASVPDSRRKQTEPIDLDTCLQAFTKEEELGEDELYYCSKCKKHCLASKKLDIWRLPPVLIVNLKRFQFLNGRWVKSHKIVKFPLEHFDPACYLAPRKQTESESVICTCSTNVDQSEGCNHGNTNTDSQSKGCHRGNRSTGSQSENCCHGNQRSPDPNAEGDNFSNVCDKNNPVSSSPVRRKHSHEESELPVCRKLSSGETECPVHRKNSSGEHQSAERPKNFDDLVKRNISYKEAIESTQSSDIYERSSRNNNRTQYEQDCSNLRYNLCAMSCHTGILGGGHYVAFAKNPNKKWYCYNDSSCKEVQESQLDTNAAYILFYQREGVDFNSLMPDISDKTPDKDEIDDEVESEYKKLCVIQ